MRSAPRGLSPWPAPKGVVLTFNDGPEPPTTARVLDIRERECVRTSFFAMSADEELLHLVATPRQASTVSER